MIPHIKQEYIMKKNYMAPKVEVAIIENEDMIAASPLSLMGEEKAEQGGIVLGKQRIEEEDDASWGNLW